MRRRASVLVGYWATVRWLSTLGIGVLRASSHKSAKLPDRRTEELTELRSCYAPGRSDAINRDRINIVIHHSTD